MSTQFLPAVTQEQFEAMTIPQRWVAVANDVLAQLNAGRVVAAAGSWVVYPEKTTFSRSSLTNPELPPCEACGVGAAFISLVRCGNEFEMEGERMLDVSSIAPLFCDRLGEPQMYALEYAFEGGQGLVDMDGDIYTDEEGVISVLSDDECDRLDFEEPVGSEERLRAIMQCIIDNGGYLIPNEAS